MTALYGRLISARSLQMTCVMDGTQLVDLAHGKMLHSSDPVVSQSMTEIALATQIR